MCLEVPDQAEGAADFLLVSLAYLLDGHAEPLDGLADVLGDSLAFDVGHAKSELRDWFPLGGGRGLQTPAVWWYTVSALVLLQEAG